jgi:hypothetical protein
MLSDAAPEAAPQEVTPWRAKRLSVNGGRHKGNTVRTMLGRIAVPTSLDVELIIKPFIQGAYTDERLSFGLDGKGFRRNAVAANRTRVSFQGERRKSSRTGLWGGRRVTGAFTRKVTWKTLLRSHVTSASRYCAY